VKQTIVQEIQDIQDIPALQVPVLPIVVTLVVVSVLSVRQLNIVMLLIIRALLYLTVRFVTQVQDIQILLILIGGRGYMVVLMLTNVAIAGAVTTAAIQAGIWLQMVVEAVRARGEMPVGDWEKWVNIAIVFVIHRMVAA
jgi:hypothetical protein